jgi:hypothetical protein
MPIIKITESEAQKSKAELKEITRMRIQGSVNQLYSQMVKNLRENMALVWQNKDGLTPQEVFDAFGTDAVELLRLSSIVKNAINAATPGTIPDLTATITPNEDGTVSIS